MATFLVIIIIIIIHHHHHHHHHHHYSIIIIITISLHKTYLSLLQMIITVDKMLSYRVKTALQSTLYTVSGKKVPIYFCL